MSTSSATIDLRKETLKKVIEEKKLTNQKAQVVLCLDYSGSMDHLYASGFVQRVVERLVPIAMQFDDNGEMELYMFESGCKKHPNSINEKNVNDLIKREISGKYSFGGTNYAPAINMITSDFCGVTENKKSGIFGRMFGSKETNIETQSKDPVYVIFITDGENSDESSAEKAIQLSSHKSIFFQFVGIGSAKFPFLEKLDNLSGRLIDNCNFFQVNDLDKISDNELYSRLLEEFPSWLKLASDKNII